MTNPRRAQTRSTLNTNTVHRVASWLYDVGYAEAGEAVLGLISDYDPSCTKPCCTEDRDV